MTAFSGLNGRDTMGGINPHIKEIFIHAFIP
jgi:hypothetical protein